ncbi:hypothetical protein RRF57_007429 [Xylaria bambusicola]|uniref:HNH nuclease domain-containing protein n=1 Tax=Xylaria bambusicola TaxID=326684 RepID=A0AAN7YZT0_9PEZI
MRRRAGTYFQQPGHAAFAILNMFDTGVVHLIDGTNIDRPSNALILTAFFYTLFEITFPIIRTLYITNDKSIDPPSPRLLAVYRAIAHILCFSAADMDEGGIQADGSTDLDTMLKLGLGGWLNKPVY